MRSSRVYKLYRSLKYYKEPRSLRFLYRRYLSCNCKYPGVPGKDSVPSFLATGSAGLGGFKLLELNFHAATHGISRQIEYMNMELNEWILEYFSLKRT